MAATNWGRFFHHEGQEDLAQYLTSYNMATQTIALDANANDIQSTGGGACIINGIFIPSLAADAALDISDSADNKGDCIGLTIANGYSCYFLICAKADGTLSVWKAGDVALDAARVCKIPAYDATIYCPVAIMLVDSNTAFTLGTTALTGLATFYQLTGPVFPHPDQIRNLFKY